MTDEEKTIIGEQWANMLMLRSAGNGRYATMDGTKTPLGIYKTICRIVDDSRGEGHKDTD
jgi:hypothetical protein